MAKSSWLATDTSARAVTAAAAIIGHVVQSAGVQQMEDDLIMAESPVSIRK